MASGWNFTLDDSSSFISYYPAEDAGLGNGTAIGWEPYWTGSGGFLSASSTENYGKEAYGQSLHITCLDGASLAFQFFGHSICLYGATNGTFDVAIDNMIYTNQPPSLDGGSLYCHTGLDEDVHYVNLTAHIEQHSGQQFQFDFANVTSSFSTGTTTPQEVPYDNTDAAVHYSGQWGTVTITDVPSSTSSAPIHNTTVTGSSASLNFTGEAVAVYGFRDWGSWKYTVTLDGRRHDYNGSTLWELPDSLLFFRAGLEPSTTHNITITNDGAETYYKFYLNSISVFRTNASLGGIQDSPPGPSPTPTTHHNSNRNVIIGSVVGGVFGFLLLLAIGLWLLRRRPDPYLNISPFTSSSSIRTQQSDGQAAPSGVLPFANASSRSRELAAKRAALANPPTTSQIPQACPVATPPQNGASSGSGQAGASLAVTAGTSRAETSSGGTAPSQSDAQPALVDRIIELIAERIDRRPGPAADGSEAPPRYPESAV